MSVLLPAVQLDDDDLELLGFSKAAFGNWGDSHVLRAVTQTPIVWNQHQGLLKNVQQHLGSALQRGRDNISQAYSSDALAAAYGSEAARWERLRQMFQGQNPVVTHPVDKLVEQFG